MNLTCPSCQEAFDLQLRPAPNLTRRIRCPACGEGAMLVLDDFGRARLDILHTSQVGIESIVVQTSPPKPGAGPPPVVIGAALVAATGEDDPEVAAVVEDVDALTPARPMAAAAADMTLDDPDLARGRKATLSEGPSERARIAISSPSDAPARPATPAAAADAGSLRLRPDLADATSRHRRATETRRDLPTLLPDGLAAAQAEPLRPVAPATAAIQTERALSPLVAKGGAPARAKAGMSVLAMALLAAGIATLIGLGAWLALRVEAGIAAKEQDRAANEAVASAHAQMEAVARAASAARVADERVAAAPAAAVPAAAEPGTDAPGRDEAGTDEAGTNELGAVTTGAAGPAPFDPAPPEPAPLDPAPSEAAPAADEPGDETARPARPSATHEVVGTAADRESPWLALRESASASSQLLAELPDGTGLRVLSRNKRWLRVQVVEGPDQGSIGWVNGRWVSHR